MIRGLIFDFDGLIAETEGPDFQAWQELYGEYGHELTLSDWAPCVGATVQVADPLLRLEGLLGRTLDRDAIRQRRHQRYVDLAVTQPLLPGVAELIGDAKRLSMRLAVASSSPREWVAGHLSRLRLRESFDCLRTADDVKRVKPAPDLYEVALAGLRLLPHEAVAFEDSPNGAAAAKLAGLFVVVVPNEITRQLHIEHADLRLDSLADLTLRDIVARAERVGR